MLAELVAELAQDPLARPLLDRPRGEVCSAR
jgi:hypothetical protein